MHELQRRFDGAEAKRELRQLGKSCAVWRSGGRVKLLYRTAVAVSVAETMFYNP